MLLKLDFASDTPIYKQIRDQMVLGIADGKLSAGEKLPTVRALAIETGVNMMTINKAYQLLKQEGYITADRRGGTTVAATGAEITPKKTQETFETLKLTAATVKLTGMALDEWLKLCEKAYSGHANGEENK